MISRRYWFRSNSRVGRWQVNGEASRRCHCLCINWRGFRMSCHIARLIADSWRLRFTIDGGTWWNISLWVEVLSIGVWLRDKCWISTRCTRMGDFWSVSLSRLFLEEGTKLKMKYLRHSCGCVVLCRLIMTWTRCIVYATWSRCWVCLMGTLHIYYFVTFSLFSNLSRVNLYFYFWLTFACVFSLSLFHYSITVSQS